MRGRGETSRVLGGGGHCSGPPTSPPVFAQGSWPGSTSGQEVVPTGRSALSKQCALLSLLGRKAAGHIPAGDNARVNIGASQTPRVSTSSHATRTWARRNSRVGHCCHSFKRPLLWPGVRDAAALEESGPRRPLGPAGAHVKGLGPRVFARANTDFAPRASRPFFLVVILFFPHLSTILEEHGPPLCASAFREIRPTGTAVVALSGTSCRQKPDEWMLHSRSRHAHLGGGSQETRSPDQSATCENETTAVMTYHRPRRAHETYETVLMGSDVICLR
ncbi:hypothetical protein MRX96_003801 [Rhipicephalus microplus]